MLVCVEREYFIGIRDILRSLASADSLTDQSFHQVFDHTGPLLDRVKEVILGMANTIPQFLKAEEKWVRFMDVRPVIRTVRRFQSEVIRAFEHFHYTYVGENNINHNRVFKGFNEIEMHHVIEAADCAFPMAQAIAALRLAALSCHSDGTFFMNHSPMLINAGQYAHHAALALITLNEGCKSTSVDFSIDDISEEVFIILGMIDAAPLKYGSILC